MTSSPSGIFKELSATGEVPVQPGKTCGGCTACCYTVAVKEIGVAPFERCRFLHPPAARDIGCSIYKDRPRSCRRWSCSWLASDLPVEYRPDRSGIVIDPLPDLIRVNGKEVTAAQYYAVRGHEDAWRREEVATLILATLDKVPAVLWRMKRGAEPTAIAFVRDSETGEITRSGEFSPTSDDFGEEGPRMMRAQQLWEANR